MKLNEPLKFYCHCYDNSINTQIDAMFTILILHNPKVACINLLKSEESRLNIYLKLIFRSQQFFHHTGFLNSF